MNLPEYIGKEHIRIFDDAVEQSDLLHQLGAALIETGAVTTAYIEAVCERERSFPTGLYTGLVNVAIPHADPSHVLKPGIALGVVKNGVNFANMADLQMEIPVHVVFLLAPGKSEQHLTILESIMNLIQDQSLMAQIKEAEDAEAVINVLQQMV